MRVRFDKEGCHIEKTTKHKIDDPQTFLQDIDDLVNAHQNTGSTVHVHFRAYMLQAHHHPAEEEETRIFSRYYDNVDWDSVITNLDGIASWELTPIIYETDHFNGIIT